MSSDETKQHYSTPAKLSRGKKVLEEYIGWLVESIISLIKELVLNSGDNKEPFGRCYGCI